MRECLVGRQRSTITAVMPPIPPMSGCTMPAWGADPPVAEAAKLTADALRAAKRAIYIEAQYTCRNRMDRRSSC